MILRYFDVSSVINVYQILTHPHLQKKLADTLCFMFQFCSVKAHSGRFFLLTANSSCHVRLDHENIASMLDSGVTTDGRFLIIEEFVSVHTLAECLDSNGFYFEERMKVALQLADALTYIHAQGIMHRDVKSANVLVDVDAAGTFTTVKLSDFGLAKGVQEREVGGTRFSSRVCGTTGYMDPECLRGEGRSVA